MKKDIKQCNDCCRNELEVVLVKYPFSIAYGRIEDNTIQTEGSKAYSCVRCIDRRVRHLSGAGKPAAVINQVVKGLKEDTLSQDKDESFSRLDEPATEKQLDLLAYMLDMERYELKEGVREVITKGQAGSIIGAIRAGDEFTKEMLEFIESYA
ncbi:hypothetical protein QTG56_25815 (plasmid) [Rossellomorea sp. AcN35-11]|nr:hypothetical protein [Rossellomorea aquimaris]WJV32034.1 hypothetical protein QTG56_25815 [Rossellomorea sp. AcN35-11]